MGGSSFCCAPEVLLLRMSADTALLAHSDCESDEEAFPIRRMGEHIPMIDPHQAARPSDAVENDEESLYPATDSAAQLKASPYYAQYTQEFRRPEGSATCCPCGHMEGNNAHLCGSGKLFPFVCKWAVRGMLAAMSLQCLSLYADLQALLDPTGLVMHVLGLL